MRPNDYMSIRTRFDGTLTCQEMFSFFCCKMIPLFQRVFFTQFVLSKQRLADHADPLFRKLQVNLVAEFSVEIVGTQPLACFVEAKRCSKNGMIPLVAELKSRFLKSKLL